MGFLIDISKQAAADLRSIFESIAFDLHSFQNAEGQLDRLEKSILSLEQMPDRFRAYEKEPWHTRGLRIMPVDRYLVFYIPDHDAHIVHIVRVMYGGRDIDTQFQAMTE